MESPSLAQQQEVPNATLILVFGIVSIVTCICYGVPGLIFGIIAIVLANKAKRAYLLSPNSYTVSSYNNVNAGKICAIIGVVLSALFFLVILVYIAFWGLFFTSIMPWEELMNSGAY